MVERRLFIDRPLATGNELRIEGDRAHYLGRVLRLRAGERITVFNGRGGEYGAIVTRIERRAATLAIGEFRGIATESPLCIRLVQCVSRGERMDVVVQKATELGVAAIHPVIARRSVVRLDDDRARSRQAHWLNVSRSACEQCGRNTVPAVARPEPLEDYLARPADRRARFVLAPGQRRPLRDCGVPGDSAVDLLVGPEGGFEAEELDAATASGFIGASVGPRVLRSETAGIVAVAAAQLLWGDL